MHELTHKEQECLGDCNFFNVQHCMTRGFQAVIPNAVMVISQALKSIQERYGTRADYLQVFTYVSVGVPLTKIYAVHDGSM